MDFMFASKENPERFLLVDLRNALAELKKIKVANAIEISEK